MLAVLPSVVFTDAFADFFDVHFDKQFYLLDDSFTISGKISDVGMPVIAMSVYDPDGKILSANNLEISAENTFDKTIFLNSSSYEKTGEYSIKLNYGSLSETHYFLISDASNTEIFIDETLNPEIILLYTEKKQYADKDIVKIVGTVSSMDSPTVLIGIYDPFGMPTGFYFGHVDSNLEFKTNFLVKSDVNFRVDGTYSIKAHYANDETIYFFDYYKTMPIKDSLEDELHEPINDVQVTSSANKIISNNNDQIINDKPSDLSPQSKPSTDAILKNILDDSDVKIINDSKNKEIKNIIEVTPTSNKVKKENNLTVEDIELGKLLNQIQLDCDSSTYIDTISYYDGMGPALYRLCNFDSSLNFFNESLIHDPNNVEILVNKGSTLGKLGYFSEAIVYYDHAIRVDPNFLPAKNNKANALANLGNVKDAILQYNEILKQNPNYLTAKQNLEIALSANLDVSITLPETNIDNLSVEQSDTTEQIISTNLKKQTSGNFFDDVGVAFSTLGSLLGFLN